MDKIISLESLKTEEIDMFKNILEHSKKHITDEIHELGQNINHLNDNKDKYMRRQDIFDSRMDYFKNKLAQLDSELEFINKIYEQNNL